MQTFGGFKINYVEHALAETTERNFPVSKHRSKRIHKKLVKRFGGEFRKEPAIFRMGSTWIVHPSFRPQIEARMIHEVLTTPIFGGYR